MTIRDANSVLVAVPVNAQFQREVSGKPFYIAAGVSTTGLGHVDVTEFNFYHVAANCAGPRLVPGNQNIYIFGTTGYYTLDVTIQRPLSFETFTAGQDVRQPGQCVNNDPNISSPLGPVSTVDISSWGLTPPFSWQVE